METYEDLFKTAVDDDLEPFPWQREFALSDSLPDTLSIPTGMGKTAGAVLGWLWRRRFAAPSIRKDTPRRLVYCLPMRVLVRQTRENVEKWMKNLDLLGSPGEGKVSVNILMGGEIDQSGFQVQGWDAYPEEDAVLIGTQDQLLSRALNRGYSMNRFKWPVHFGLLNNDALWIIDETQLMGAGFPTTAQLNGLRCALKTMLPCRTVWMSATLEPGQLATFDNSVQASSFRTLTLTDDDLAEMVPRKRLRAAKTLERIPPGGSSDIGYDVSSPEYQHWLAGLAMEHHRSGTLTIVMVNRIDRAQGVFRALKELCSDSQEQIDLYLLHSRFRAVDRMRSEAAVSDVSGPKGIVVTTQVLEAGVDVSARTLITENAPWSSMVQRFGRCNRYGEHAEGTILWIDLLDRERDKKAEEAALPYSVPELALSSELLQDLHNASPLVLQSVKRTTGADIHHIPRRRDILQLFDTSPDLMGFDLDVSRFIRDTENNDLQVFWRSWESENNVPDPELQPLPEELCRVSLSSFRNYYGKLLKRNRSGWVEDHITGKWRKLPARDVRPGIVILLEHGSGGYSEELGWTADRKDMPQQLFNEHIETRESLTDDSVSTRNASVSLRKHSEDVSLELATMIRNVSMDDGRPKEALKQASLWHDAGKAHEAFQNMLTGGETHEGDLLAKSDRYEGRTGYFVKRGSFIEERPFFRHELLSALWYLSNAGSDPLTAFLIASHHGKVRTSIRSNPREKPPRQGVRYTAGILEGDLLPALEVAPGLSADPYEVRLDIMELGGGESGVSWVQLIQTLVDEYGPFRLAFMEALLRTADWRASRKEAEHGD